MELGVCHLTLDAVQLRLAKTNNAYVVLGANTLPQTRNDTWTRRYAAMQSGIKFSSYHSLVPGVWIKTPPINWSVRLIPGRSLYCSRMQGISWGPTPRHWNVPCGLNQPSTRLTSSFSALNQAWYGNGSKPSGHKIFFYIWWNMVEWRSIFQRYPTIIF